MRFAALLCFPLLAAPGPPAFEPNRGQAGPGVEYVARIGNYTLGLLTDGAVIQLPGGSPVRMLLERANGLAAILPEQRQPGSVSYFRGLDPKAWITALPRFGRVRYRDVYPGIDLIYYTTANGLEYDFVLAPGADAGAIAMRFTGAGRLELSRGGDIIIHTAFGDLCQHRPRVFQDGRQIQAFYRRHRSNRVSLEIARYDRARPLTIDPSVTFSTMLGGSGSDVATAVATDVQGAVYLVGSTNSTDFPGATAVSGPLNRPITIVHSQAFAAKLSPDGSSLEFAAYLGGNNGDGATGVGVDAAGNVYIAGSTNSFDFPTTPGAYLNVKTGLASSPFIAKLDRTGEHLVYSTLIGPTNGGSQYLRVDPAGYAYLAGTTFDAAPSPTLGALQSKRKGNSDAYILKLNRAGSALVYATYLGGSLNEAISGLDVSSSGEAYVIGGTTSSDFPLVNAYQSSAGGPAGAAFVARLNADGSSLIYSTLFEGLDPFPLMGGSQFIAADGSGGVFLGGNITRFQKQPPLANPIWPDAQLSGAYLGRLDSTGASLSLGTAVGTKNGAAILSGLALSSDNRLFLLLSSSPPDLPGPGSILPAAAVNGPGLVCLDAESNEIDYITSLPVAVQGGWLGLIAALPNGEAILAGTTFSSIPTTPGAYQSSYAGPFDLSQGAGDAFAYRVSPNNGTPTLDTVSPDVTSTLPQALYLFGSNFVSGSTALVNGIPHKATPEAASRISVPLATGEFSPGQVVSLQVVSPGPGGGASATRAFTLLNPAPSNLTLTPNRISTGTGDTPVLIRGLGLVASSVAQWNGSGRPVRFIPPNSLEMTLSASDVAQSGQNTVTVTNSLPGGGSASAPLAVTAGDATSGNPLPILSAIPISVALNGSTVFIGGSGFVAGSVARWNGSDRPTEFVSANSLRATLSAEDVAAPGSATVTVFNPAPGGGVSAPATAFIYLPAATADLAWEPVGGKLFVATTHMDPAHPDSILRIDPTTGAIEAVIPTAASPSLLALSSGGEYLYTALKSQLAVQRVDLSSNTAAAPFRVDFNAPQPNFDIAAIQVLPSSPDTIVVARSNNAGLAMFDSGVPRPDDTIATQLETNDVSQIAVTDTAIFTPSLTYYGAPNSVPISDICYDRLSFDSYGLRRRDQICDGALDSVPEIRRAPGLTAFVQKGQYSLVQFLTAGVSPPPPNLRVNPIRRRVYALSAPSYGYYYNQLTVYDEDTFAVLSSTTVPYSGQLVLWGDDGVAFLSGGVYIFHDK